MAEEQHKTEHHEGFMSKMNHAFHHDKDKKHEEGHSKDLKPGGEQIAAPERSGSPFHKFGEWTKKEGHKFAEWDRAEGQKIANDEIWGSGGYQHNRTQGTGGLKHDRVEKPQKPVEKPS